jgi:hypothetical protein
MTQLISFARISLKDRLYATLAFPRPLEAGVHASSQLSTVEWAVRGWIFEWIYYAFSSRRHSQEFGLGWDWLETAEDLNGFTAHFSSRRFSHLQPWLLCQAGLGWDWLKI